ncbi:MAG: nitrilase [Chloroflexi bacterium]|nr:nitrilase [Chloroflexota bacterium]
MLDVRIAVVQMTSRVGDFEGNLARVQKFLKQASAGGVDIVCFPELCISGYNTGDARNPEPQPLAGPWSDRLVRLAREANLVFLAGLLERGENGIVYNTQVVAGPNGILGHYRKTHVPTTEIGTWSCGGALPVFRHHKVTYGLEICYDSHFPEVSTALAERGAEVLFLPHASGGTETAADKKARWLRYMPARAYDNTVFVAVCNQVGDNGAGRTFVGVSFVCDPAGKIIAEAKTGDSEEMVIADLKSSELAAARSVPESFFRHFRRPEKYAEWLTSTTGSR